MDAKLSPNVKHPNMEEVSCTEQVKLRVKGQKYAVVNLIGPGLRLQSKDCAFRILGVFNKDEEARAYIKKYEALDSRFDMYVCAMYEFLPFPAEVHEVGDVIYDEDRLNELLAVHHKTRTTTQEFNERVDASVASGGVDKWGMAGL